MVIGVVMTVVAFGMDTTVTSTGTFIAGTFVGGGSTHNLGLLQQQMMVLQTGLAAFLAGAFLFGIAPAAPQTNAPPPRRWDDVRDDETEEERDERVTRIRRRERIGWAVIGLFVAGLIAFSVIVSQ